MRTDFHHKFPYIVLGGILLFSIYLVLFNSDSRPLPTAEKISPTIVQNKPFTASFLIVTNGTERIFSGTQYHNLSKEVYIQNPNPAIIHITSSPTTWGDFFSTLPMGLSDTCLTTGTGQTFCDGKGGELRFFINEKESSTILDREIYPKDMLLITFGTSSMSAILQQISRIPDPDTASDSSTLAP